MRKHYYIALTSVTNKTQSNYLIAFDNGYTFSGDPRKAHRFASMIACKKVYDDLLDFLEALTENDIRLQIRHVYQEAKKPKPDELDKAA